MLTDLEATELVRELMNKYSQDDLVLHLVKIAADHADVLEDNCAAFGTCKEIIVSLIDGYAKEHNGPAIDIDVVTPPTNEVFAYLKNKYGGKSPKLTDMDESDYKHQMTIQRFRENVECGGIMDCDGFGYYGTATQESDKCVDCDVDLLDEIIEAGFYTHVTWYNK